MKLPLSNHLKRILNKEAVVLAKKYERAQVLSVHLLLALHRARYTEASRLFQAALAPADLDFALLQLWGMTPEGPVAGGMRYTQYLSSQPILESTEAIATESGSSVVAPVHLALALLADKSMRDTLRKAGMETAQIENLRRQMALHALYALSEFDGLQEAESPGTPGAPAATKQAEAGEPSARAGEPAQPARAQSPAVKRLPAATGEGAPWRRSRRCESMASI